MRATEVWYTMPAPEQYKLNYKELNMRRTNNKRVAGIVTLAAVTGLSGCASTSEIESLRSEIRQANDTATNAASTAEAARSEAAAAARAAAEANATAEEAKAMAEATDAKIDRMFKKSMYK